MQSFGKEKSSFESILLPVIYFLILLTSLNNVNGSIRIVGLLFIIIILISASFFLVYKLLKSKEISKFVLVFLAITIVFFIILMIGLYNNFNLRGFITAFQFFTISLFTLYSSSIFWNDSIIRRIGKISVIFILIHFIIWIMSGFPSFYASVYNNSNLMGPYMYFSLFFLFISYKVTTYKIVNTTAIMIGLIIIFASGTRSIMFAAMVALLIYFFWNKIIHSFFTYFSFLLIIFSSLISFIFLYPKLPEWKYFLIIERWILDNTGKSIMSGREDIWSALINITNDKPLLGLGTGVQTRDILSIDHSSHNYYLNTIMQNGYLGLLVILLLFTFIWFVFWKVRFNKEIKVVASYFISTLVYQSFEISLTQNQLSLGLLQWFIISFGLSIYLYETKYSQFKKNTKILYSKSNSVRN